MLIIVTTIHFKIQTGVYNRNRRYTLKWVFIILCLIFMRCRYFDKFFFIVTGYIERILMSVFILARIMFLAYVFLLSFGSRSLHQTVFLKKNIVYRFRTWKPFSVSFPLYVVFSSYIHIWRGFCIYCQNNLKSYQSLL